MEYETGKKANFWGEGGLLLLDTVERGKHNFLLFGQLTTVRKDRPSVLEGFARPMKIKKKKIGFTEIGDLVLRSI